MKLYEKYNIDGKINMIIGTDAFAKIKSWYETDKLKNLVKFVVFKRENDKIDFSQLKKDGYNFVFADMNFVDISSTELRKLIKEGISFENLVTNKVKEYINENGLYRD